MDLLHLVIAALVAIGGGIIGALVTLNVVKAKVDALEEWRKQLESKIVFKDTCAECKNNWMCQVGQLREDIKDWLAAMNEKLDRLIDRLAGVKA